MKTQQIQNNGISFGIHNNKYAARRVLANVAPEARRQIYNDIERFCQLTQKHGIKGELRLLSPERFSIKLNEKNEVTYRNHSSLCLNSFIGSIPHELWKSNVK